MFIKKNNYKLKFLRKQEKIRNSKRKPFKYRSKLYFSNINKNLFIFNKNKLSYNLYKQRKFYKSFSYQYLLYLFKYSLNNSLKFFFIKKNFFYKYIRKRFYNQYYRYNDYYIKHKKYLKLVYNNIIKIEYNYKKLKKKYKFNLNKKKKLLYKKLSLKHKKRKVLNRKKKFDFIKEKILELNTNTINIQKKLLNLQNFKNKKYLKKYLNLIYLYFNLKKNIKINLFNINKKSIINNLIFLKKNARKRGLIKYLIRFKKRKNKYLGNLSSRSYNFYKIYCFNDDFFIHFRLQKLNLNDDYKLLKQPYKFGKINISIKQNNTFVNLKDNENKMICLKNAGLPFLEFKNCKKKTNYCKERIIKSLVSKALLLNYKIVDINCNFFSKRCFFHIQKALIESNIFIRLFFIKINYCHGYNRYRKLRRV